MAESRSSTRLSRPGKDSNGRQPEKRVGTGRRGVPVRLRRRCQTGSPENLLAREGELEMTTDPPESAAGPTRSSAIHRTASLKEDQRCESLTFRYVLSCPFFGEHCTAFYLLRESLRKPEGSSARGTDFPGRSPAGRPNERSSRPIFPGIRATFLARPRRRINGVGAARPYGREVTRSTVARTDVAGHVSGVSSTSVRRTRNDDLERESSGPGQVYR